MRFKRDVKPIPEADWSLLTSEAAAVKYCCEHSGMQDKAIALEIDTDAALLSKAKAGQARLSEDARRALRDATGCDALLYAEMLSLGYDPRSLRKLETETERQLREANEALEAERTKVRVLTAALRGEA